MRAPGGQPEIGDREKIERAEVDRMAADLAATLGRSTATADDKAVIREGVALRERFPLVADQMARDEVPRKIHGRPLHEVLTSAGAGPRTTLDREGRGWALVDPDGTPETDA